LSGANRLTIPLGAPLLRAPGGPSSIFADTTGCEFQSNAVIFVRMKKLTDVDTTLIVYSPTFTPGYSLRDPWPTHAASYPQWVLQQLSSNNYCSVLQVFLEDGLEYFYCCGSIAPYELAAFFHDQNSTWCHPDGTCGKFGEWWNYNGRATCFNKGLIENFSDWVLHH
jgi:hypothetical protein